MEYWLSHRPTDAREYPEFRADRILSGGAFPADILARGYCYFPDFHLDAIPITRLLVSLQNDPDKPVRIYRGAPSDGALNTGDWVTLSRRYAEMYAGDGVYSDNPDSKVYEYVVKASDLSFDGDSIYEFGYWGPKIAA